MSKKIIRAENIDISYDKNLIVKQVSFSITEGKIVTILGTNGCGKSTLLKAIARAIPYKCGKIYLEDKLIERIENKEFAKKLAFVSQNNEIPEDITVFDFVKYGRIPHKKWYELYNQADIEIINWAIKICRLEKFINRKVMSLSGGERQKVWIAMALAQKTEVLLLDEPTTYLDICHQFEIMELIKNLNRELGITIIMVLHDLNQAIQYSDEVLVIKDGKKYAFGEIKEVLTSELVREVYNVKSVLEYREDKPYFILEGIAGNKKVD